MNILVLTNLYPPHAIGGYEERCRQIMERIAGGGHRVRILTSTYGVGGEEMDGEVRRRLRVHGMYGAPWLPVRRLYEQERANHCVLGEEIAEFRPDVVHVWNMGGISKGLLLALQDTGLPIVYDVSDHWIARSLRADVWLSWWNGDSGGLPARLARWVLRATGRAGAIRRRAPFAAWNAICFDRIYFCSEALKRITMAKGYDVGHAEVIHCGVETGKFALRPESERFTRLLYVGRLSADKDPLTAVRALGELHRVGRTQFTLNLYGRGDEDYVRCLGREAEELGVAGAVHFRSADAGAMKSVYAEYDALLFTSAWEEPFALTPLEAMASGVPVVATLEGGSRELVRDGENACAFATGNADALAERVEWLSGDPSRRERIVGAALEEVRREYDIDTIARRIADYLEESLRR